MSISIVTCSFVSPKQIKSRHGHANRFVNAAEVDTYWSVIDQADVHHGLEHPIFNSFLGVELSNLSDKSVVEFFAFSCVG